MFKMCVCVFVCGGGCRFSIHNRILLIVHPWTQQVPDYQTVQVLTSYQPTMSQMVWGSNPQGEGRLFISVQMGQRATQPPAQWDRGSFPGVKVTGV